MHQLKLAYIFNKQNIEYGVYGQIGTPADCPFGKLPSMGNLPNGQSDGVPYYHVGLQATRLTEGFWALLATIQFLTTVYQNVDLEMHILTE